MGPMAFPVRKEKISKWKAFAKELKGSRKKDFDAFNQRYGLTRHDAWLEELPDGSAMILVQLEGPGADRFIPTLATANQPFDVWFRDQISDAHDIDFRNPPRVKNEQYLGEGASP